MSIFSHPETPGPSLKWRDLWPAVLMPWLALALAVVSVGVYTYGATRKAVTETIGNDMRAIAKLKVGQIEQWLAERRDDAQLIATSQFSRDLQQWIDGGMQDNLIKQRLLAQLRIPDTTLQHRTFSLRSPHDGKVLLTTDATTDMQAVHAQAVQAALRGKVALEDIHFADESPPQGSDRPRIEVGFFTPLFSEASKQPQALLHIRMNPEEVLYPLLQTWPGISASAETLLLRTVGEKVIFLNDLRHIRDSALRLTQPTKQSNFIAARVITEGEGFFEDNDYRGVPSLGYGMAVAGTPWVLVAKIDRDEAYRQLNIIAALASVLLFILLLVCAWWLITRKREELRLSRLLWEREDLYQNAPCGYHSLDKDGKFLRINDTELRMLGYAREEVLGRMHWQDLLTPEGLHVFNENFPKLIRDGQVNDLKIELIRKDGTILPTLISATAIRDHRGQFLMSRSMVYDMSALKCFEDNLRHSEERFRALFSGIQDAVFVHSMSADGTPGSFVEANAIACERLGYSRQELLSLSPMDIDAPESGVDTEPITRQLAAGTNVLFEQTHLAKNGRRFRVEINANTFMLQGKRSVVAIVRDITERRQHEETLRLLRRAIESSSHGLMILSLADEPMRRIIYVNPAFERITGYRAEEIIGKTAHFLLGNEPDQPGAADLRTALEERREFQVTLRYFRKDGTLFLSDTLASPVLDANHRATHYVGLISDVTVRQAIEQELVESRERLRQLASHDDGIREVERKHIARELHDELGQLLTVLKMDISLLQMKFDEMPELMEKTEEMRMLVENTIGVVRNAVSDLRPAALDLGIVGALEWLTEDFTRHTGIRCDYSGEIDEPILEEKMAVVVFRIAQESLTNVARHAAATRVSIRFACTSDKLNLSIDDDGRGFCPSDVERNKANFGLLGMQERVTILGGLFKIESAPGDGTQVTIELPLTESKRP